MFIAMGIVAIFKNCSDNHSVGKQLEKQNKIKSKINDKFSLKYWKCVPAS